MNLLSTMAGIGTLSGSSALQGIQAVTPPGEGKAPSPSFGEILQNFLEQVNQAQLEAENAQQQLVLGEKVDLHTVMLLTERANLALQFTVALRNKLLDAYSEIMRMQV